MQTLEHDKWKGTTAGTPWMQRSLVSLLRHVGVRPIYRVMACTLPFFILSNLKGAYAIWHYLRRRMLWSRLKAFAGVWRTHYNFGQVVIDRFAVYAGRDFDFEVAGEKHFRSLLETDSGMVVLTCHAGNPELAGYSLRTADKTFHALVYGGEKQTVMANRAAAFGRNNVRMVPVSEDMSHIFALNDAISEGGIAGLPCDRLFGSNKSMRCSFLGADAEFPMGPFLFAVQKDVPVVAMFVMKEGTYKYKVYPYLLDYLTGDDYRHRMRVLANDYVRQLESVLRTYPCQWFNFYEFWE